MMYRRTERDTGPFRREDIFVLLNASIVSRVKWISVAAALFIAGKRERSSRTNDDFMGAFEYNFTGQNTRGPGYIFGIPVNLITPVRPTFRTLNFQSVSIPQQRRASCIPDASSLANC